MPAHSRTAAVALLIAINAALVLCWSAGFIGIRFATAHAPIFLILFWRNLVSGLVLLPFALTLGPRINRQDALPHVLFGALALTTYLGGFAFAISRGVPTGLVALISDMLPLIVALLSWPVLGQALSARQWLGTCIGLAGVLLASGPSVRMGQVPLWAYALPVLGTLCLALAMLLQQRGRARAMPMHQNVCLQSLSAAAIFAVVAWQEGGVRPILAPGFIGGILWLVFVATLGAWAFYYLALRQSSPARVTSVLYLSPPVVMLWAWVMFGEPLSWAMAGGLVVSLAGIVIVARPGKVGRVG